MRNAKFAAKIHLTDLFLLIFPAVRSRACCASFSFIVTLMSVVDGTIILLCLTCGASSRPVLTAVRRYGCCVFFLTPWNFFCLSLSFPLCNCVRVLRKPQFHRDTIHGDVSCRRRDHIALADVRCVVTAGLDGIASLRLLCLLLNTVELIAIFILTDLVQWYNSQM